MLERSEWLYDLTVKAKCRGPFSLREATPNGVMIWAAFRLETSRDSAMSRSTLVRFHSYEVVERDSLVTKTIKIEHVYTV